MLPARLILTILEGTEVDMEEIFPLGQVNFALTLPSALYKLAHWARQSCFADWSAGLSLMVSPLTKTITIICDI